MKQFLRVMALVVLTAALAGCATMEYQSGPGAGEVHPGHVGHERH